MYRREFRKFSTASFANCAYNSGWQSVLVRCVICKQTIAINDRRFTGGSSVVQLACAYDKSHGEESPSFIVRVRTSRSRRHLQRCSHRLLKENAACSIDDLLSPM